MTDEDARRIARLELRLARERAARRAAERIAEDALRRSYEANELKTVLLGTVNHELRTPAAVIHGCATQLERHWDVLDDAARVHLAGRIAAKAHALSDLIQELLELASLEAGAVVGVAEEVVLRPWLCEVAAAPHDGTEDGHVVNVEVPDDLTIHVNRGALRHIIVNLVGNARRYAPLGTTITVAGARSGDSLVLTVGDEGPGIAPADRLRVFEPFYRGQGDHVLVTSGFGIGLSLVRRLTGLLGGDVRVGGVTGRWCGAPAPAPDRRLEIGCDARHRGHGRQGRRVTSVASSATPAVPAAGARRVRPRHRGDATGELADELLRRR